MEIDYNSGRGKAGIVLDLVIIILNSGFALTVGSSSTMIIVNAVYLLFSFVLHPKIKYQKRKSNFLILFLILMIATFVFNLDFGSAMEYLRIVELAFLAFYISCNYSNEELIKGYCMFMRVDAAISCAFYLLFTYASGISFPEFTNPSGISYYTCILGNINTSVLGSEFIRNSGVFWEGGMYAAFVAIWIIFEIQNSQRNKLSIAAIILGLYTIYTTKSTSGYLYIILLLFLFIIHSTNGKRRLWQDIMLFLGLFVVIYAGSKMNDIIVSLSKTNASVFGKLIYKNASYTDRLYGPAADFIVCLKNPFGVGTGNVTEMVDATSQQIFGTGLTSRTSTLTYFFATFGFLSGILVNYQWIRYFVLEVQQNADKIIIIALFVLLCSSTPLNSNLIFWIILFCGAGVEKYGTVK